MLSIGLLSWLFTEHHKAREISHKAFYQLPPSASPYPSKDPTSRYHLNLWGMFIYLLVFQDTVHIAQSGFKLATLLRVTLNS